MQQQPQTTSATLSEYEQANFINKIFYGFAFKISLKGFITRKTQPKFQEQDLLTIPHSQRPEVLSDNFTRKNQKFSKPNLSLAILSALKWPFIRVILAQTITISLRVFSAWVVKRLVEVYLDPTATSQDAYKWTGILVACLIAAFLPDNYWNHYAGFYPSIIQNALIDILYGKVLKLSAYSLSKISSGKIINIAADNLNFLDSLGVFFPSIIVGIYALLIGGVVIWQSFGVFTLIGIGYIVFWYPIQIIAISKSMKDKAKTNDLTSERVKKTSETIESIRLLKMYTWEMKFKETIENIRVKELSLLKKSTIGSAVIRAFAFSVQDVGTLLMFLAYYYTGHTLLVADVFSTYFVFNYLRLYSSYFVVSAMLFIAEARSVFKAIEDILSAPETNQNADNKFAEPSDPQNSIEYEDFTAFWEISKNDNIKPMLDNINLKIKQGSVNALVGIVGSGKTSLLMSLTGEMPKTSGSLKYKGTIAYVEQEPTIFAGTFKENVLFGREYDEKRYKEAIETCCLKDDLRMFTKHDESEISQGGNNLSGGQKVRLAFARAVYADADIYLLDDPISAVDPKVARKIYKNVIEGVLKGKTVILVTHQIDFVKNCENIILMEAGKVLASGTLKEIEEKGIDAEKIFSEKHHHQDNSKIHENNISRNFSGAEESQKIESTGRQSQEAHHVAIETEPKISQDWNNEQEDKEIISGEHFTGNVTLKTYFNLIKEMGGFVTVFLSIAFLTGANMAIIGYGRMLGAWIAGTFEDSTTLGVLGGLAGIGVVFANLVFLTFGLSTLLASKRYHKKILSKTINAKTLFFDMNSVGQIIHRFSNDIGVMDKFIPLGLSDVLNVLSLFIAIFITVGIICPILLAPLLGAFAVSGIILYVGYPAIEKARIYELNAKDPVFNLLSETLNGLVIMRMYNQGDNFRKNFRQKLHQSAKGIYSFKLCTKIVGFYADLAYTLAIIASAWILTAEVNSGNTSPFFAPFIFALVLGLVGLLSFMLRQFSSLNISMSSVARLQEFCNLPSEPPQKVSSDSAVEKSWPTKGKVDMKNVYMKYRPDNDFVIKGLDLQVNPGEKVGCVGRTGAGKSTIVQLLYRMREIDRKKSPDGFIQIDDVNTQSIGLNLLRKGIDMIPQTPYIFSETIRFNIDPLKQYTDEEIWKVLEDVRLRKHVEKQADGLNTKVNGGSSVFSVGQKQLVCLARVISKPARLLIMDEATANMDYETDNFLQEKINQRFEGATRFTIAHRLTTIAGYDKVLVLSKGKKVEFDEPYKLLVKNIGDEELTNSEGHFAIMVQNTGPISSKQIFDIAKESYFCKHQ